ncbi:Formyl-CoA:oxalate CoA-transferase [Achromobacter pulmonis]|uniref:Formyl-CoA:oxalate CoA-transferase n=1 Tax=Achromobacter pulmonis TaxID=1389932 RepID=A0A6S7BUH1_9BURK|nr:CoA transferase [Achromobacter pulmonis]CAB3818911.1 Formyl-CoA:oxalate CoA-transferase [Achromobacter pulmonis]
MSTTDRPVPPSPATADYLRQFWLAAGGHPALLGRVAVTGHGALPSVFAVTEFATAAIGAAGLAMAEFVAAGAGLAGEAAVPAVEVDQRLASFWFGTTLRPVGWTSPPLWDPVAGDYLAADGWIRLHTNAPHHRDAALAVLGVAADRDAVARAVARWRADDLEAAVVARNGCAAAMRGLDAWRQHPQGQSVAAEPLLHRAASAGGARPGWRIARQRPLQGLRVLDLTRILAGPVATRFLAGFGADVLRIDPPGWDEPGTVPEVVLGKRCARLDLKSADGRATLQSLLSQADVLIHGYRADALARLGLDADRRRQLNPTLVDVSLDAYGWSGPWRERRGFDSLVQMSTGIADAGMRAKGSDRPVPLPCQALDHATGYLMAAAALRGLTERLTTGAGSTTRASLARSAQLLVTHGGLLEGGPALAPESDADWSAQVEATSWGPARRIKPPLRIADTPQSWDYPASALGTSDATWRDGAR